MDIRFGDHPSFHRTAAGMVGGAALLGLALHPFTAMAFVAAGLGGIASGAALGYGRARRRLAAGGAAAALVIAVALVAASPPSWAVLAIAAALGSLGLSIDAAPAGADRRMLRGALVAMYAAGIALAGMWAALRFGHARQMAGWPAWTTDIAAAAAMGMIGVLAVLPRHLRVAFDPIQAAVRRLPARLDGEVRALCDRSLAIWTGTKQRLADGESGRDLVRDGVLQTLEVAARSVEVELAPAADEQLVARIAELDTRIAAASDAEVKSQYEAARRALDDQRRYRAHIRQNRERLVARMHNHVAALEKFQLAATGLAAARATTAVHQLDQLSHDVAESGDALAELELGSDTTSLLEST